MKGASRWATAPGRDATYCGPVEWETVPRDAFPLVICRSCGGGMRTCYMCLFADSFPLQCAGKCTHQHDILREQVKGALDELSTAPVADMGMMQASQRIELAAIHRALDITGGNVTRAAIILRTTRRKLSYRLKGMKGWRTP